METRSISRIVAAAVLLCLAYGVALEVAVSVTADAPRRAAVIGKSSHSLHVCGTPASSPAEQAPSRRLAAGRRVLSHRDGGIPQTGRQRLAELTTLRI